MLVGRVFTAEPGIDEQFAKVCRCDLVPRLQVDRGVQQSRRSADSRQQRGRRGHDDAGGAGGEAVERASASGSDADVGRHAAVGVDFVGGEAQNGTVGRGVGQPFEGRHEEADVGDRLLEVAVAGDDVEHDTAGHRVSGSGDEERLG